MHSHYLLAGLAFLAPSASSQTSLPPLYEIPAFASVGTPTAMGVGDFDGNGLDDLVIASLSSEGLELRLQDADLAFCLPIFVGAGRGYLDLKVLDLNADGDLDLLACDSRASGALFAFLGNGNGAFQELGAVALAGQGNAIALGDVDLDGNLDVAVTLIDSSQVQVLLGAGNGSFTSLGTHFLVGGAQDIVMGDIDQDGNLDLVTAGGATGTVSLLYGLGQGTFSEARVHPALAPEAVRLGDLDGDGDLDAVVATFATKLVVLENVGGNFAGLDRYDVRFASRDLELIDQDGDGDLDAILALADANSRYTTAAFSVALGDGAGGFVRGPTHGISVEGDGLDAVLCHDLDGDGAQDILSLGGGRGTVSLFRGDGVGGYFELQTTSAPAIGNGGRSLRTADFDGDGFHDLLIQTGGLSQLEVLLSRGDGTFSFGIGVVGEGLIQSTANPRDLNGDGLPDLIFAQQFLNKRSFCFALAIGAGSFGTIQLSPVPAQMQHLTVLDWNGDGALDVFGVSSFVNGIIGRYGDGSGGFLPEAGIDLAMGGSLSDIGQGDFNGDGNADLVAIAPSQGILIVLLGDGSGAVGTRVDLPLADATLSNVRVGDLDRDGLLDLVTSGLGAEFINIYYGASPGTFNTPVSLTSAPAELLELADIDRDGWLDIIGVTAFRLSLHRSDGSGGFHLPQYHDGGGTQTGLAILDSDADGLLEVFTSKPSGKSVTYYSNRD